MFSLDPNNSQFLDTLEFFLKIIGGLGAFYLFFEGLVRYKKEQIWKRQEFVAKEISNFTSDFMVRNALYMLDWGKRYIELFPNKEKYDDRYVKVTRESLKLALQIHTLRPSISGKDRFTLEEVAIRDTFDQFFFYLERFYQFIEAGLISSGDLKPYLNYWLDTLEKDVEEDTRKVIYKYIEEYKFKGVQKLFDCYQRNIKPF